MTTHPVTGPEHHRMLGTFLVFGAVVAAFFGAALILATIIQAGSLFN